MTKNEKPMLENAKPHQHSPPASEPGRPLSPCGRGLRRLTSSLVSRSWVRGSALSVTHHATFVQMETLRQYNLAQSREDKKKVSARPVIGQSYFGDDAPVTGILISSFYYFCTRNDNNYDCHYNKTNKYIYIRDTDIFFECEILDSCKGCNHQT